MNYGELKDLLRATFNRSDITDELAGGFIKRAITRLERLPDKPAFLERMVEYVSDGSGKITVPTDFLKVLNLYIDGKEIRQVDMAQFQQDYLNAVGYPHVYVRVRNEFWLRPHPEDGKSVFLHYYGSEPPLMNREDVNGWTLSAEDAVLYGAMELAADYYEDDRLQRFADKFKECAAEIADQVQEDQLAGPMVISPAYGDNY